MSVVLYLEKQYGKGKPLQDFSSYALIEPPEWVKTYFKYRENTLNARNEKEYLEWGTKTYQWLADYLPVLGTVGYNTYPVVASNRLKNVWPWNKGPFETENMLPQWYLEE